MEKRNEQLNTLFKDIHKVSLDADTKHRIRENLLVYSTTGATASSFAIGTFFARYRVAYFAVVPLVLLLVMSTVAFAAEKALPNNPLYSVKVGINEPIKLIFTDSPSERALKQTEFLENRFIEAETLLATNELSENSSRTVTARLSEQLTVLEETLTRFKDESPLVVEELSRKVSTLLSVHGKILASLGGETLAPTPLALVSEADVETTETMISMETAPTVSEEGEMPADDAAESNAATLTGDEAMEAQDDTTEARITAETVRSEAAPDSATIQAHITKAIRLFEEETEKNASLIDNRVSSYINEQLAQAQELFADGRFAEAYRLAENVHTMLETLAVYNRLPSVVREKIPAQESERLLFGDIDDIEAVINGVLPDDATTAPEAITTQSTTTEEENSGRDGNDEEERILDPDTPRSVEPADALNGLEIPRSTQ